VSGPLVSVVVPVFRGMPYLSELVESVKKQTYGNLELVAAVTPTDDGSEEVLSQAGFTVIKTPVGTSAAKNWTIATEAATGTYIKLICQDDTLYPHAIEQQVSDLQASPGAVMAIAKRDIINSKGSIIYAGRGLSGLPKRATLMAGTDVLRASYLKGGNIFGEPLAVLFTAGALKEAMPWRDDNPLMLDLNIYTRVAAQGDIALRRNSIGAFRVSATSWSTQLAKSQLEQTAQWQSEYQDLFPTTQIQRSRATLGRHIQTSLRRAAYANLKLRGSLT
jgi:glycosyltransferase involved in cell wall biosynthesis